MDTFTAINFDTAFILQYVDDQMIVSSN